MTKFKELFEAYTPYDITKPMSHKQKGQYLDDQDARDRNKKHALPENWGFRTTTQDLLNTIPNIDSSERFDDKPPFVHMMHKISAKQLTPEVMNLAYEEWNAKDKSGGYTKFDALAQAVYSRQSFEVIKFLADKMIISREYKSWGNNETLPDLYIASGQSSSSKFSAIWDKRYAAKYLNDFLKNWHYTSTPDTFNEFIQLLTSRMSKDEISDVYNKAVNRGPAKKNKRVWNKAVKVLKNISA